MFNLLEIRIYTLNFSFNNLELLPPREGWIVIVQAHELYTSITQNMNTLCFDNPPSH